MAEEVKLLTAWSSLFALRAEQALRIKGLDYEEVVEDLKNKSDSLLNYNPIHKKVPVLLHKGKPICESLVILEYIDEVWKHPPLLPQDPYHRAMARFWAKFGDQKLLPSMWRVFIAQGSEQEEATAPLADNLNLLEEQLKGKRFFGGERIGYLDLALGWMANLTAILEEIIEAKLVDADRFPLLTAWMKTFYDDPVIKELWPSRDDMIQKFKAILQNHLKQE